MRRVYLRGARNILKRLLIHVAGFNLSLLMRKLFGVGTPRSLQDRLAAGLAALFSTFLTLGSVLIARWREGRTRRTFIGCSTAPQAISWAA